MKTYILERIQYLRTSEIIEVKASCYDHAILLLDEVATGRQIETELLSEHIDPVMSGENDGELNDELMSELVEECRL